MSFSTCCRASSSLLAFKLALFSQSAYLFISLSDSCLSGDGPTMVVRGRGRGGEQQESAAAATSRAGLGPWSGPSADSSGAAAWIDGIQGLSSPRVPSLYSMTWEAPDVLGSRVRMVAARALLVYGTRSQGSHPYTQLGTLLLLPVDRSSMESPPSLLVLLSSSFLKPGISLFLTPSRMWKISE